MAAAKKNYIYATGRRRTASARVRLFKGQGENIVNDLLIGKYFPGEIARVLWNKPFALTTTEGKYFFTAKIVGGGKNSQLDAMVLAISKALVSANTTKFRLVLKQNGLLTRDDRERERRKVNTGGRARRKKQSPKR